MKQLNWLILLLTLTYTKGVSAILLDCEENSDGTYLCIRLDNSADPSAMPREGPASNGNDHTYLERAKEHCVYREPTKRGGKTGNSPTRKMEAIKAARADYDRCVIKKAHELLKAEKTKNGVN